ncbi:hypothetical protein [Spirosoma aerolatum]|uniref:hypothetical protein n=1 Tax=Spirosoma aerolatum TaxID=1211326 RepID=UPI0009AE3F9D|nr:hypothetical protein [Spirosoma aerolatum]
MEDPKVPFADTTARRAELIAATERLKSSISNGVETIKEDATELGKTTLFVAGAALAVYLVVNAVLPKSDEYRYAEKYGEPDDEDYDTDDESDDVPSKHRVVRNQAPEVQKTAAVSGLISGIVTTVLTNIAREQLTGFLARIRSNNAINPTAEPTDYHEQASTQPVDYTP